MKRTLGWSECIAGAAERGADAMRQPAVRHLPALSTVHAPQSVTQQPPRSFLQSQIIYHSERVDILSVGFERDNFIISHNDDISFLEY